MREEVKARLDKAKARRTKEVTEEAQPQAPSRLVEVETSPDESTMEYLFRSELQAGGSLSTLTKKLSTPGSAKTLPLLQNGWNHIKFEDGI